MGQVDQLIRTKLRLPSTRPGLVPRLRLQEQVLQGLHCPLTLIIAPAGFGKTTLIASCVAHCGLPVAWLSLEKNDDQIGRFLNYLTAALKEVDQRIGNEAAQLLSGMQQASPEAVLTSLINDLDAVHAEFVLVLDDYQFITSPAINSQLTFFIDHCPHSLHLLIATRSDPPISLARLRAGGQMVELRASDLRFNPEEAKQFLNDVMGLHLNASTVASLEERTEGWIAGLQMAALSMRDRKDVDAFIEGFSGTNRYILDYLLEEVLSQQPPEVERFLLYTSILGRLTAPLCDALLAKRGVSNDERTVPGEENGKPLLMSPSDRQLGYLERENLFLVALDDGASGAGAGWFRYHHLFADLLQARLQQTQPNMVPHLHLRASIWFEGNGFIPEAIQHLFAAHEIDRAADLIERYGPVYWAEHDPSVMQMADRLPRKVLVARPKIGIHQAWLLINQGKIETALPLLNDLSQQLAGAVLETEQQWIHTLVRLALAFLLPPADLPGTDLLPDPQLLDEIPAGEEILRDTADLLYAMALLRRGEIDLAADFAVNVLKKEKASCGGAHHPKNAIPLLVPFLASVYWFQGRLHAAAGLCREFLDPIKQQGIRISAAGNLDIVLGSVLYEWNHLEEAEKHIRDGLQANEPWGNIMTDGFGLYVLTNVLQAKGKGTGAMQMVEKLETRLQGPLRPAEYEEMFRTLKVRVQLANRDLRSVSDWAEQINLSDEYHRHPEYYRSTLARIRLAQSRYTDVEEILTGISPRNLPGNRVARQIDTHLLLAAAAAGQNHIPGAMKLLDSCLALAEPEGYLRIFIDFGVPVRELLAAYLRSADVDHKPYAQKVLDAFSPTRRLEHPGSQTAGLIEPLTGRELEVLQLMAAGKTNQEIAGQLVVALGTIKAHAASIYRKLDVAHRTEAIARARQLGILP